MASITILKYLDRILACLTRLHISESLDVARYACVFSHVHSGKHSSNKSRYFANVILVNAAFNFAAKDYSAFGVNIAYIICLISMAGAFFAGNTSVVQGMIGALMMACVWGNVNVLTEMLYADIPSRSLWQVILGAALTMVLFINHFLISREKTRTMWRIKVNQIIIMLIIILRTYQVIINILAGGFTPLVIEITVGLLAIIPTLDAIASIEAKTDAYVAKN